MSEKRKRGRPPGTGKDDSPHLRQVATFLIETPGMAPTTAMHRVMSGRKWPESDATLLRRWQVKWKAAGESYLAEAREARDTKTESLARLRTRGTASLGFVMTPSLRQSLRDLAESGGFPNLVANRAALAAMKADHNLTKIGASLRDMQAAVDAGKLDNRVASALVHQQKIAKQAVLLDQEMRRHREHEKLMRQLKLEAEAIKPLIEHQRMMKTLKAYGVG